jgi:hypothetical protein
MMKSILIIWKEFSQIGERQECIPNIKLVFTQVDECKLDNITACHHRYMNTMTELGNEGNLRFLKEIVDSAPANHILASSNREDTSHVPVIADHVIVSGEAY